MNFENEEPEEDGGSTLSSKLSGFGQKIIGEIETIGGILTADPNTQAEGEFNVEVGDIREDIEDDLEKAEGQIDESAAQEEKE